MLRFIVRRLAVAVPVLIGVTILVFAILHAIPGNPAQILLFGSNPTPGQIARLRHELGLDRPVVVQYLLYLSRLLHGDLGTSYVTGQSVGVEIASRLPATIELTLAGMAVAVIVGVPLGLLSGTRPGTWLDRAGTGVAVLGIAVPYFWLALLLILIFAVKLHVLPSLGSGSPDAIVLPAVALGYGFAAIIARLLRGSLIEVYQQSYMLVAESKGLTRRMLLYRHALKNALGPVVTILGLQFGNMLAGAVAIEVVFGRTGVGSYLVNAIEAKDIPAVQGIVLVIAALYVFINLVVDLANGMLDPRIRLRWAHA